MQMKNNKGITLVTLTVTIIVLIILTSITLVAAIGDNGLITILQQGRENIITDQEIQNEKLNKIEEERQNTGIINPTGGGTNNPSRDDTGVNSPVLGDGMIPIKNNGENWVICSTDDIEWFDYIEQTGSTENGGTSKWANIMLSDGKYKGENAKIGTIIKDDELGSMFVWIPRYAYKITYYTDSTKATTSTAKTSYGNIDVKFIKGNGNIDWNNTQCKYVDDDSLTQNDYIIHPAFTDNANEGGGFGELSGLWIAKFEVSRADATSTSEGISENIKVVPNVMGLKNMNISDMYLVSKNYNKNLDSHMLKNSEWGVISYLAHSKYGRNGAEVAVNQCGSYITGMGPGNGISNVYNSTYSDEKKTEYSYNTTQGKKASTTGNVYGIYDMSGGASEAVACYYNGSNKLQYGDAFAIIAGVSNEYVTVYEKIENENNYKNGMATYETANWNLDSKEFVNENNPFFIRGGYYIGMDDNGIFSFKSYDGNSSKYVGFRTCLIVR